MWLSFRLERSHLRRSAVLLSKPGLQWCLRATRTVGGLESFDLEVQCDDDGDRRQVTVSFWSEGRSYRQSFGQGGDWLNSASFDPIEAALAAETTQRLRYSGGGNEGKILIVDAETAALVDTYL